MQINGPENAPVQVVWSAVEVTVASAYKKRAMRIAVAGWIVLFLAVSAIIAVHGKRSVVPAYRTAALSWISGQSLYDSTGVGGFVYLPQSAVLFVPFALLPPTVGDILWRLGMIAVFVAGLYRFGGLAGERSAGEFFPLMSLVTIPLVWDCARNGQATLIITGLMLLAVADIALARLWRATLWLSLGVAIKPLVLVLVLLAMAIDRRMSWRLLVGLGVTALSPFLTQAPGYVVQQYSACVQNMTTAAHVGVSNQGWTSPFTALRALGIVDVPESIQTAIRLAGAIATLLLCFFASRRLEPSRAALYLFTLASLYLMLFSPRTENNTYAMLSPAIAAFLACAFLVEQRRQQGMLLACMVLMLVGSRFVERLLAPHAEQVWLSPFVAVLFAAYALTRLFTDAANPVTGGNVPRTGAS
ncbi:MAG TPA: glycosyltransferase family 87 protein [Nitrospirota bacterium]|nr:glycosyltransferase family 87 protein [Nitrospirota bacterium]